MRRPFERGPAAGTALLYALVCAGCLPPGPMGYIVPGPQRPGRVVVAVQGGGGGHDFGGKAVGGSLHVEPFVTARHSLPVSVTGAWLTDTRERGDGYSEQIDWFVATRLGFRYRVGAHHSVGAGVTGGALEMRSWDDEDSLYGPYKQGLVRLDFEWSWSRRWSSLGLCFTQRLTVDYTAYLGIHFPTELTLAWFPKEGPVAVTASLYVGWSPPVAVWAVATAGVVLVI